MPTWCAPPLRSSRRDGRLYVFLPPLTHAEHWLDLIACDRSHRRTNCGPWSWRATSRPRTSGCSDFAVTPDPGCHRGQHPPGFDWRQMVAEYGILYEEAARRGWAPRSSCSTAATPAPAAATTSPWAAPPRPTARFCAARPAAQPDHLLAAPPQPVLPVLRACSSAPPARRRGWTRRATTASTNWRSPSSRCRAATSPALAGGPGCCATCWSDMTGNTHRAEFCIDKLYSPGQRRRPSGPGGVPRLRDAAPRPHEPGADAAAALAGRALLERALPAARCAGAPSCTTASCCRTSSGADFEDVIATAARRLPVRAGLVRPVPRVPLSRTTAPSAATASTGAARAIEPWNVLGEEVTAQGTARFVDSSVERLQVKVSGLTDDRHVLPATAAVCPCAPRAARASTSPACASRHGARHPDCTRPSPATTR